MQLYTPSSVSTIENPSAGMLAMLKHSKRIEAAKAAPKPVFEPFVFELKTIPEAVKSSVSNFFLSEYTEEHKAKIRASAFVVLDSETTGLVPNAKPLKFKPTSKIGGAKTWKGYQEEFKGATVNTLLRMAVWSIGLEDGAKLVWDMDALPRETRKELLQDSINGKVTIFHNAGFDFTWATSITGADLSPALVLDTMLIVRCLYPAVVYEVHKLGLVEGSEAEKWLSSSKASNASASLAALVLGLELGIPDKSYQPPENWCVRPFSQAHYDYVVDDVTLPWEMLKKLTGCKTIDSVVSELRRRDSLYGNTYFDVYEKAPLMLAKISHKGMPVNQQTAQKIREFRQAQMPALVEEIVREFPTVSEVKAFIETEENPPPKMLIEIKTRFKDMDPEAKAMEAFRPELMSGKSSLSAAMKRIVATYAHVHGKPLKWSPDGPSVNSKDAVLCGASKLPAWGAWDSLQGHKKVLASITEYLGLIAEDGRLHGMLTVQAATCRLTSTSPNTMNMSKPDPKPQEWEGTADEWAQLQFRGIIDPGSEAVIMSSDYSQVELRIIACLAQRAERDAVAALNGTLSLGSKKAWFLDCLRRGENLSEELDPSQDGFPGFCDRISATWRRLKNDPARSMSDIFKTGIDPHLMTGLSLASMEGLLDLEGLHPIKFMERAGKEGVAALKKRFGKHRNNAKAVNFGLGYGQQVASLWEMGITTYGLSWTMEEAAAARAAWFNLFPDVEFLIMWIQFACRDGGKDGKKMLYINDFTKKLEVESIRLGASQTLRGRPVVGTASHRIGNYQSQGSGADALLEALTLMNEETLSCVINLVHDEIVLEVPKSRIEPVKAELERAMRLATDKVFAQYGIPSDCEADTMAFWRKE